MFTTNAIPDLVWRKKIIDFVKEAVKVDDVP